MNEALTRIRRNSFMSVASIVIIAISSFILGVFLIMFQNVDSFAAKIEEQAFVEAYFKRDTPDAKMEFAVEAAKRIEGVRSVRLIGQKEAVDRLAKEDPTLDTLYDMELLDLVPASMEIQLNDPTESEIVADIVREYEDIENVRHGNEAIARIISASKAARGFGVFLLFSLGLGSLIVIFMTISMSVFAERSDIHTMRLLGATQSYITKPYMMEGLILGFVGGVFAFLFLKIYYSYLLSELSFGTFVFALLPAYPHVFQCGAVAMAMGMLFGMAGSILSVLYFLAQSDQASFNFIER